MRRLKHIFLWSLGFLLLLVIVSAAFLATAGNGFYRWAAQEVVEKATGRDVHFDGSFSFDTGWEPTLVVTDVRVENAPWAEKKDLARVRRAEVQIALKPLFRGIVLLPRLVVDGMTLELETGPGGEKSWQTAKTSGNAGDTTGQRNLFLPLFDLISLKDVSATYRDRPSGRVTKIVLKSLEQKRLPRDEGLAIRGDGSVNETAVRIQGRLGSIRDALEATKPFPLHLTVEASGLMAELTGTARNLPRGEGLDIDLTARTGSIAQVLKFWRSDLQLAGQARVSARLTGNLGSATVKNLVMDVSERSGRKLHAEGSVANLRSSSGLDIRFKSDLLPQALGLARDLPPNLGNLPTDITRLDMAGRITGQAKAPAFEQLRVQVKHRSGADLSLQGHFALNLAGKRTALTALGVTSELTLPDASLIEQALKTQLPRSGPIRTTSELSLVKGSIVLRPLDVKTDSFGGLQLKADGRLGRLPENGVALKLDPELNLRGSIHQSRPLVSMLNESLPELGPIMASARLHRTAAGYALDKLRLTVGAKDSVRLEAAGTLGGFRPQRQYSLNGADLNVSFVLPSSQPFKQLLPTKAPELKRVKGRFHLSGSPKRLSISKAQIQADGPYGLSGKATGDVAEASILPRLAVKGLLFDLTARSPDTNSVARLIDLDLPELGPVRARAALKDHGDLFSLAGIDVASGPSDKPSSHITGEIGDLLSMKQITINGHVAAGTTTLLGLETMRGKTALGKVVGDFNLSDADGSLGIETVTAEVMDTALLKFSATGVFDDIKRRDELRFQVSLEVASPSAFGRAVGLELGRLGAFSYTGRLWGSEELFHTEGKAQLGETDFSGALTGSLTGKRPSLRGKLYSPILHFADLGIVPALSTVTNDSKEKQKGQWLFDTAPLPLETLKEMDLDLDVLVDQLEGVGLEIDNASGELSLKDGLLKIEPFTVNFIGGNIKMEVLGDTRPTVPRFHVRLEADDVNLGDFLAQVNVHVPLDGELDMDMDLKASGSSPRALSSSLQGAWNLAVERGHIRTRLLALSALDVVSWMFSKSVRDGYSDLTCFIARMGFQDGVGKFDQLLLDTPNVLAQGAGRIDLRDETLEIKSRPHPKRRRFIQMTTPFEIEGPLVSPTVRVSTTGATARTVGEILASPLSLLGQTFLRLVNDQGRDNNNPCLHLHLGAMQEDEEK